jgi:hypothetical protein
MFDENIVIYANYQQSSLHIGFGFPKAMDTDIRVTDVTGKIVASQKLEQVQNNYIDFNTFEFTPGVYSVTIQTAMGSVTKNLVIQ